MVRPKVAVVIPAFNEEKTIRSVICEVIAYGVPIVVNDGSTDDTALIAVEAGAFVVSHNINRGYDAALESGFKEALRQQCKIIVTFDADGQHTASLLETFLASIDDGADVVIGIRNRSARISETFFSWVARRRWKINDPLCGMKAYRSEVYQLLGHFDSYGSIGTELCIFASKNQFQIREVLMQVKHRTDNPRIGSIWLANLKIFRAMLLAILR